MLYSLQFGSSGSVLPAFAGDHPQASFVPDRRFFCRGMTNDVAGAIARDS